MPTVWLLVLVFGLDAHVYATFTDGAKCRMLAAQINEQSGYRKAICVPWC